ncbi:MAG TPA: vanadium-dependent haloperoxidase [Cyclobacteriaceae bacterium]|nr:vanadium-dependent haloperoxidase [Cyclobacteriaceae bacterium]HPW61280.1 vanadium-dependent haloperoxidase [Cyclobacteriaceae bacterium]
MRYLYTLILFFLMMSCTTNSGEYKTKVENPEYLHRTLKQITDVIVHDIFSPPVASRIYAYASLAAYEAAIPMDTSLVSLGGQLNGLPEVPRPQVGQEYSFPLASIQAMFKVGRTLVFSEDKMDLFYAQITQEFRDTGIPEDIYDRSIEYGNQVADHILAWAAKDNYKQSRSFPKYSISNDPSTWKPTPPAYMDAVEPHWNKIRTFVIDSASQFMPERPTPFSIDKASKFYSEAKEVLDIGNNLTQEEKEIAFFWDCNPFMMNVKGHVMFATKKISPGGHWINITAVASRKAKLNFVQSAEAYALVSLALADGFISCWDEKYRSVLIRPESYINQYMDENWVPLLQTPPFPEYTSGHSVISNSASTVLTDLLGENFAFTDSTEIEFGLTARSFSSFQQASDEAAISRVYGGIHYKPACEVGKKQGVAVGMYILSRISTRKKSL